LANNTGGKAGGEGKIDHGYQELYFTKKTNLKRRKTGPIKRKVFYYLFPVYFYLSLFKSVTKKVFPD
jgi:hypothetical protein